MFHVSLKSINHVPVQRKPVKKVQQKCSFYVQRRTPQAFLYYDEYLTFIQYTRRFESRNSHDIALVFSKLQDSLIK